MFGSLPLLVAPTVRRASAYRCRMFRIVAAVEDPPRVPHVTHGDIRARLAPASADRSGDPINGVVSHQRKTRPEEPEAGLRGLAVNEVFGAVIGLPEDGLRDVETLQCEIQPPKAAERPRERDLASAVDLAVELVVRPRGRKEEVVSILKRRNAVVDPIREIGVRETNWESDSVP